MSTKNSAAQIVGYRYYMGLHFGLCYGPVDALLEIRGAQRTVWLGPQTSSGEIQINSPNIYGGDSREGGVQGPAYVMMGEPTQQPNTYLTAQQGQPQPAYRGICTFVFAGGQIASNNPYPKPWSFRVRRAIQGWFGGNAWNPGQAAITLSNGVVGMNPAHIVYECLTNPDWGMGYPPSLIDPVSFSAAATQFYNEGMGLCLLWTRQDTIESFLQQVMDHAAAVLITDRASGLFVLTPLRGGYSIPSLPVFTQDNVVEVTSVESPQIINTINEIVVTYVDPTIGGLTYGGQRSVAVQALGSIQAQGVVLSQKKNYPGIASQDLALRCAQRDLQTVSSFLRRVQIKLDRTAWQLVPGGLFVLDFPPLGISQMVFRVGDVDYGTLESGAITVTAVQDVFSLPATAYVAVQTSGWTPPTYFPTATTAWMPWESSYRDLAAAYGTNMPALTSTSGFAALAALRPEPLAYDYQLWSGLEPSPNYARHGSGYWTPLAQIVEAMGPFDTSCTLMAGTDLINVRPGSQAVIDDGAAIEVVRVDAIDPVGMTATIARGCADTVASAHVAGVRVWFLDAPNLGTDGIEYTAGEIADFAVLTETPQGYLGWQVITTSNPNQITGSDIQNITSQGIAPNVQIPINGRQALPYPPAEPTINGTRFDQFPSPWVGTLALAWKSRNRITQADQLIDQTAASFTPESGETYNVRVFDNSVGTLLTSATGLTATTWSFSLPADHAIRIEIESQNSAGQKSWQMWRLYGSYVVPVTSAAVGAHAAVSASAVQAVSASIRASAKVGAA